MSIKTNHSSPDGTMRINNSRGVVMVEMSISIIVVALVFTSVIDISVFMYKSTLLNYATNAIARDIVTDLAVPQAVEPACVDVRNMIDVETEDQFQNKYFGLSEATVVVKLKNTDDGAPYWALTLESEITTSCLFCNFLDVNLKAIYTSDSVIENAGFSCAGDLE